MEMSEISSEELFNSVIKGVKKIKIDDKEFEIDITNAESLTVLQFYSIFYKNTISENPVSQKSVDLVHSTMKKVFVRSYPGIDEKVVDSLIESRFLDIISGVSIACGWMKAPKENSEIEGVVLNNE